jgi:hypothetical protein
MREIVLRDLFKRNECKESEIKKTQNHHGFYQSVEIKLTVRIPQRNTRARAHAYTHTHMHAQNITCLLTSQIRDRRQHKYYVTGRGQKVGIKLRTERSAKSGQFDFKLTKSVIRM